MSGPGAMFAGYGAAAPSGPKLVQQKTGTVVGGPLTVTMDAPLSAGNALFVCVSYATTSSIRSIVTAPASLGNGSQDNTSSNTAIANDIWYFDTTGDGTETGVVVDQASGLTRMSVWVGEFSGINTGSASEAKSNDGQAASSNVALGSIMPISITNLTLASFGMVANDYSSGPTSGFIRATPVGSGSVFQEVAYKIQLSDDLVGVTWILTAGINWAGSISTFGGP